MSRYVPDQVSRRSWRAAAISLALMTSVVIITALLIARQGQAIKQSLIFDHPAERWTIRFGRAEVDRLTLRPAPGSIGLALHPIESTSFTLQARVAFDPPQGAAGLIVRADDPDHFTAILVSGDGYFRVCDYRNGLWIDRAAWRAWPHIRRNGTANVLRAECQSDSCTFFVNDEWTWQEQGLPVTHWIGVVAVPQATGEAIEARFDQLSWRP